MKFSIFPREEVKFFAEMYESEKEVDQCIFNHKITHIENGKEVNQCVFYRKITWSGHWRNQLTPSHRRNGHCVFNQNHFIGSCCRNGPRRRRRLMGRSRSCRTSWRRKRQTLQNWKGGECRIIWLNSLVGLNQRCFDRVTLWLDEWLGVCWWRWVLIYVFKF